MKKYGFVYLWYDKKRKMYYVGCHWGHIEDGYICSSNRMRDAYKRRPQDFKRRIIKKIYTSRIELLQEEFKWLSQISEDELNIKYYNNKKHHCGHWSSDEYKKEKVIKKLKKIKSNETKELLRQKAIKQWKNIETRKKHSEKMIEIYKERPDIIENMIKTKTGKKLGPYKGKKEYSDGWKKTLGLITRCRKGKGGKFKSVLIDNIIYYSITEAASKYNVSTSTISQWIKNGKAKVVDGK